MRKGWLVCVVFSVSCTGALPGGSIGSMAQAVSASCQDSSYAGDVLPDVASPAWAVDDRDPAECCINPQNYGQSCVAGITPCEQVAGGLLTITKSGESSSATSLNAGYVRQDCAAVNAASVQIEARLKSQPDVPTPNNGYNTLGCGFPPPDGLPGTDSFSANNVSLILSDGTKSVSFETGIVSDANFGRPAGETFIAIRHPGKIHCADRREAGQVLDYSALDVTRFHTYRVVLTRNVGAQVFVDGAVNPTLQAAYANLSINGVDYDSPPAGFGGMGFVDENGIGTFDFVNTSVCGGSCPGQNHAPDCTAAAAGIASLWPPNHKMVNVHVTGVTDVDGDPIAIKITGITSDEANSAPGSGNTTPDCTGAGGATASLRSERSGQGNGRVYGITFTASDGKGGSCDKTVSVCVPHDQGGGSACIDDGQRFDCSVP